LNLAMLRDAYGVDDVIDQAVPTIEFRTREDFFADLNLSFHLLPVRFRLRNLHFIAEVYEKFLNDYTELLRKNRKTKTNRPIKHDWH